MCYMIAVLAVMYGFNTFPLLIPIPFSTDALSFWSIVVGGWFILRDYAQRELGHYVLLLMSAAVLFAFLTTAPGYALASIISIFASEVIDYLIYTLLPGSFPRKVIISSIAGSFVDTFTFFYLADILLPDKGFDLFTVPALIAGVITKVILIYIWYFYLGGKDRNTRVA